MIAVPELNAVTAPVVEMTLATAGVLLDHVTVFIEALAGVKFTVNVSEAPAANDSVDLLSATLSTAL